MELGCDFCSWISGLSAMARNNGCLKHLVLTAFVMTLVIVQHVKCKEGDHVGGNGFVRRSGTNFILNGKSFHFNGFNAYWLMYMASDPSTRSKVTTTLQEASHHGLRVARTWAFSDGVNYRALQISPGSYDEEVFRVRTASSLVRLFSQLSKVLLYVYCVLRIKVTFCCLNSTWFFYG